jgi:hypothetical protein
MEEVIVWQLYRNKRGSLHPGMRTELAVASMMALYANSKTGKDAPRLTPEDFAPHMDERVVSMEQAMKEWR